MQKKILKMIKIIQMMKKNQKKILKTVQIHIKKKTKQKKKRKQLINQAGISIKRKNRKIITIKHLMIMMMAFFQNFLICFLKNLKY